MRPSCLAALGAAMRPTFTLGIEEEYQTVDPETRDLRSHIHAEILEKGKLLLQERVPKATAFQPHTAEFSDLRTTSSDAEPPV